jgi:AraC family transcriptional regulator, arabinose operon regulatory protein
MQQHSKNLFEIIMIKNLICRLNVCAPEWGETDCLYGYNKFYYFLEGEGTIIMNGNEYHPRPGELFLIAANTRHSYYHNPHKPVYKYWCHFDLILNEGKKLLFSKDAVKCQLPKEIVIPIFEKFINLDISINPLDTLTEKSALLELLKLFLEHVELKSILPESTDDFVSLINAYIIQNLHSNITLKQLANIVHLHPNYFIQFFKNHFSVSPIEHVNAVRLERAAQLFMQEPDKSIAEVAYKIGFKDYRYFSRLFRRRYGLSPSAYKGTVTF